ncbi:hypothetical protein [Nostoc sp. UHCC 0252]|uniref:hypothetical protein n=1 Tax=Nostoc sp. UHCC 0252 TaxID=3110241 RepID=UPI002B1F0505|nr:hypothetical protein [Nostoc sp. UHCC 0252]MEA5603045.1 hypothetical protein [Nostoc sp. UHCC 0252]
MVIPYCTDNLAMRSPRYHTRTYATPILSLRSERSVGKQSQRQGGLLHYRS